MIFDAPNTKRNRIAATIAIVVGLAVGFYLTYSGGKNDKASEMPNEPPQTSQPVASTPDVPAPPKSLRLEDIDFSTYSQELARFTGLTEGQSRIEAIDNVRLYFAPEEGANIINTSQSSFDRDDGSVLIFGAAGLPDDSVKAQEIYLILTGPKPDQKLAAYGMRVKCHRGENSTNWQNTLCP
jgi:hypothetical protein